MNQNGHSLADLPFVPYMTTKQYVLARPTFDNMMTLWPFIRAGLQTIKRKDKRSGQWTTEHVRAMLEAGYKGQGTCELWMINKYDGKPAGFVVTSTGPDPHLGVPLGLFVWITYLGNEDTAAFYTVVRELETIARSRGLRYLEGMSSRAGWARKLAKQGYDTHMILYRKQLWEDE
jgi:hypothetical protein